MHKKTLMIYGLAIALVGGSSLAMAGEGRGEGKGPRGNPEERLQRMQQHLDLSDDQVSQIQALQDSGLSRREMRDEIHSNILTDDQRTRIEEHRASRRQ